MAKILQMTFSKAFSWMRMFEFQIKFHWNMLVRGLIDDTSALVQVLVWCYQAASCNQYYHMTVWILAGNGINLSIAAGLIRLHMRSVSSNLMCNEGERMSPYFPYQSLAPFTEDSTNYCCLKQYHNCQLKSQIPCKYVRRQFPSLRGTT